MTDFKLDFGTKSDPGQAATEPREALIEVDPRNPVDEATYDHDRFVRLPGVDVSGSLAHRPHGQPH